MLYKKIFFPIGGGEELQERIHGALLIAKHFNTHLEILKADLMANTDRYKHLGIPLSLIEEMDKMVKAQFSNSLNECIDLLKSKTKELDIAISDNEIEGNTTVNIKMREGVRSELVEQESKFCDLVIAAAPPSGLTTATFETSVIKSGKPVLMFPRVMKKFDTKNIIIGWNNSTEVSRAITSAIGLLKQAKKVHIISSKEYAKDNYTVDELRKYLDFHQIETTFDIVETTRTPGEALYREALNGNFDLMVAGAYGHNKGLRELFLGGATRYLLEHSTIPVFMSH